MLTKEQIDAMISKRASDQFSRDVYRLGLILAQNYGELRVGDMQNIIISEDSGKKNFLRALLRKKNKTVMSDEANDRYYLMQMAFKIMDIKMSTKITFEDLKPQSIRPIYLKYFRKEYEEYERQEYNYRDVPFQERALLAMIEFKDRKKITESEMI